MYEFFPSEKLLIENGRKFFLETPLGCLLGETQHNEEIVNFVRNMLAKYSDLHTFNSYKAEIEVIKDRQVLEPLYSLGLNKKFNKFSEELVILLQNKGANLFSLEEKTRDIKKLVYGSNIRGLVYFIQHGIVHPEEIVKILPHDEKNLSLRYLFSQYICLITIGTVAKSRQMEEWKKWFSSHKRLKHLIKILSEHPRIPQSLEFLARRALREKLLQGGCLDLKTNDTVLSLPKSLREYLFFCELDVNKVCHLYTQFDCGCKKLVKGSVCPQEQ